MAQLREALEQAVRTLTNESVESPRLDAELLLGHVLGVNRAAILTWPERRLTPKELTLYRNLVRRRAHREPLAYILGFREFYGLDFHVDPRVLIPRPETELLVEQALGHARRYAVPPKIADVGTGSGVIAVTLAAKLPGAHVYALDGSVEALEVAEANAHRHGVAGRVHCVESDLLVRLPESVDLIVANLPYVTTVEWENLPPEIRGYEPRSALDGGPDGLFFLRRLLADAGFHLRPGGVILLEIGASQGALLTGLAHSYFDEAVVSLCQDYAGLDRLVVVQLAG